MKMRVAFPLFQYLIAASQPLENAQQSKEIKACLEQLYKFIFHLENRGTLSDAHAGIYRNMIKRLLLELAVEEGSGVVIVTHDETLLRVVTDADVGSQVLRLEDGVLAPDTSLKEGRLGEEKVRAEPVI